MSKAEIIRAVLRSATEPLTFAQIKQLDPRAEMNALWAQVLSGVVEASGSRGSSAYRLAREPRPFRTTPEQREAAKERKRQWEKNRSRKRPRSTAASKPRSPRVANPITWAVPIAPSKTAQRKKVERPAETVAQWMARTGKQPERLGPHDISTPFRHIGRAA